MSMTCKVCGGDTGVKRTIDDNNRTVRTRVCKECEHVELSACSCSKAA